MKVSFLSSLLVVNILGATAVDSIFQDVSLIPSCAFEQLKKALKSENCGTTDIGCMCRHSNAIVAAAVEGLEKQCTLDFGQAFGSMCGIWDIFGSTATSYAEATSLLAKDLNGANSKPSATTTADDSTAVGTKPTATDSAANQSAATTSAPSSASTAAKTSSNIAAMPTVNKAVAGFVGLVGGAAALGGMLI
ncbi:hypothetical protein BGZ63DRAFT_389933 [Mariannaea sp. PMI_226]|nr:hypothetical protein BGZ63DRAFT_389933 [Mariannaea sp. PMI_226]